MGWNHQRERFLHFFIIFFFEMDSWRLMFWASWKSGFLFAGPALRKTSCSAHFFIYLLGQTENNFEESNLRQQIFLNLAFGKQKHTYSNYLCFFWRGRASRIYVFSEAVDSRCCDVLRFILRNRRWKITGTTSSADLGFAHRLLKLGVYVYVANWSDQILFMSHVFFDSLMLQSHPRGFWVPKHLLTGYLEH